MLKIGMNKRVVTSLVLILVASLGIGGYFFFQSRGQNISELFSSEKAIAWPEVKAAITNNCRGIDITQPHNNGETSSDISSFLTRVREGGYYKPEEHTQSFRGIPLGSNTCFVVFIKDKSGNGRAAYETKTGEIRSIKTKDFIENSPGLQESEDENRGPRFEYTGTIVCEESVDGCPHKFVMDQGSTLLVVLDNEADIAKMPGLVGSRGKILGQLRETEIIVLEIEKL